MLQLLATDADGLSAVNATARPFPDQVSLPELIAASARRHPERIALRCDHDSFLPQATMTYGELDRRSGQVAAVLRARGVGPGTVVPLLVERSYAMLIGIYAILRAGAAYLPVSPEDPAERVRYVLADAKAPLVLVQRATAQRAPAGVPAVDLEDEALYRGGPLGGDGGGAGPEDLAYVIYTSGSTGRPKGVMIEHRSVVNRLHWMQEAYPLGPDDVLLLKTAYTFDVSVWELFWWALAGASLALLRPRGERLPSALVAAVAAAGVTVLHFVPSMLNVFLEYVEAKPGARRALAPLRRVFASGEALPPAAVHRCQALLGPGGTRLTNLYGPTEATVDATFYDCPAGEPVARVPIGRPIANLRAYVLRDGAEAPVGETGELCLAGVGLARGYLGNPELTAQRFCPHPARPQERIYRTGDLARWLPDGNLEYLGREDHQVKIRGLRIELGEIENAIRAFPGVVDAVVSVWRCSESITLLVAYVVADPLDRGALQAHLRARLPAYMVPSQFEQLAALPLTASGKADRRALPPPALGRRHE